MGLTEREYVRAQKAASARIRRMKAKVEEENKDRRQERAKWWAARNADA
jgi:hypothetical protein